MTTKRTINTPHDTAQAVSDIGVKHCIIDKCGLMYQTHQVTAWCDA